MGMNMRHGLGVGELWRMLHSIARRPWICSAGTGSRARYWQLSQGRGARPLRVSASRRSSRANRRGSRSIAPPSWTLIQGRAAANWAAAASIRSTSTPLKRNQGISARRSGRLRATSSKVSSRTRPGDAHEGRQDPGQAGGLGEEADSLQKSLLASGSSIRGRPRDGGFFRLRPGGRVPASDGHRGIVHADAQARRTIGQDIAQQRMHAQRLGGQELGLREFAACRGQGQGDVVFDVSGAEEEQRQDHEPPAARPPQAGQGLGQWGPRSRCRRGRDEIGLALAIRLDEGLEIGVGVSAAGCRGRRSVRWCQGRSYWVRSCQRMEGPSRDHLVVRVRGARSRQE